MSGATGLGPGTRALRVALHSVVTALCFTALAYGLLDDSSWLLALGLTGTALWLALMGKAVERHHATLPPGSGQDTAFAPAVVHSTRVEHKDTGQPALDPQAPTSVFVFDLTVLPEDAPPFRAEVRGLVDLQGLRHRRTAVVEYAPKQPWRVQVPQNPPGVWRARADRLDPDSVPPVERGPSRALVNSALSLGGGAVLAAALLWAVRSGGG